MEIVKKNLISIICGVVALGAVVYALVFLPGNAQSLQKQLDTSKASHDSLAGLLNKDRSLPVVDPDKPDPVKLTVFPSEAVIKQGDAITKAVEGESKAILAKAVEMNKHSIAPELSAGTFPAPSQTQAFAFRNWYTSVLPPPTNPGATAAPIPGTAPPVNPVMNSKFAKDLKAGMPPTPEEIRLKQEALAKEIRDKNLFFLNGAPQNQQQVDAMIKERTTKLPLELREQIANTAKIYINPDTFEVYPKIAASVGAPELMDMYFAQLGYWIQQDVVDAINYVNRDAKNVVESPVKHLITVRSKPIGQGAPNFIVNTDGQYSVAGDGALPKAPAVSPTGRVSNGLYDVFHFVLDVDVEADKLPDFLRGLSYRKFITPLSADVKVVDNAAALGAGHVYGSKPMLNARVECEVLYLRSWHAPLMPAAVRTKLAIPAETPAAPTDGTTPPPADGTAQPAAATQPPADGAAVPAAAPAATPPADGVAAPAAAPAATPPAEGAAAPAAPTPPAEGAAAPAATPPAAPAAPAQ